MADIGDITRKRNGLNNQLQKILDDVNNHSTVPLDADDVKINLKFIEDLTVKYDAVRDAVMELCADDAAAQIQADIAVDFSSKFRQTEKALRVLERSFGAAGSPPHSSRSSGSSHSSVKLPRLSLPTFSGKVEEWTSFQDLFLGGVDAQTTITAAQKLQYLKAAVTGEAERLIRPFQVTDSNYKEAWEILRKRYNNERELIHSLLKRMFGQPAMKQESASALQALADTTSECERSLSVLKVPLEHWDYVLSFIVTERMDSESRRQWELTLKGAASLKFKDVTEFIEQYVRGLQAMSTSKPSSKSSSGVSSHHTGAEDKCEACSGPHFTHSCANFKAMGLVVCRQRVVRTHALIFKCLGSGHGVKTCKSSRKCKTCSRSHHTLLHSGTVGSGSSKPSQGQASSNQQQTTPSNSITGMHISANQETLVLLSTALVTVVDRSGKEQVCRALLDACSQATFITEQCAQALGLKRKKAHVAVTRLSSKSVGIARHKVSLVMQSCLSQDSIEAEALILPEVTGVQPKRPCSNESWSHISGIQLADPGFDKPGRVDILIGADILSSQVMKNGMRRGAELQPTALNTIFGWVLSGPVRLSEPRHEVAIHYCDISESLVAFQEIEELPYVSPLTKDKKSTDELLSSTHTRDTSGRYVVDLPFHANKGNLGTSLDIDVPRLQHVERSLEVKPEFRAHLNAFTSEYLALGYMDEITSEFRIMSNCYYLLHNFVLRLDSSTTKVRVMVDGSSNNSSGLSLNEMHREFKVNVAGQDYQRNVWHEAPNEPFKDYRPTTLSHGTLTLYTSYLLTKYLQPFSGDVDVPRVQVADPLLGKNLFVVDYMGRAINVEKEVTMHTELRALTQTAGMHLLQFYYCYPSFLTSVPEKLREKILCTHVIVNSDLDFATKYSNLEQPESVTAYVLCLAQYCRRLQPMKTRYVHSGQITGLSIFVKQVTARAVSKEPRELRAKRRLSGRSSTRALNLLFDGDGRLRVGGSLRKAEVEEYHRLTFKKLQTLLAVMEFCLNSRQLCAMSSDPADFTALTPGHFFVGHPLTALPYPDLTHLKVNRLFRWQLVRQMTQHFWRRWSTEYLSTLQQRFKWTAKRDDLNFGNLVLVKDGQQPEMKWKMERITVTHPGHDKIVRVVFAKTSDGGYKRPVVKICPLMSSD